MKDYIRVGKIISLHGIKGEVKVYPTTDDIKRFSDLKKVFVVDSEDAVFSDFNDNFIYTIENVKYVKNAAVVKIVDIDSIEQATGFVGKNIYVKRTDAIKLQENEYFVVDIIGLNVYCDNVVIGKVIDIMKNAAHDILVVDYSGKDLLIPMVDEYVSGIDMKNGKVNVLKVDELI